MAETLVINISNNADNRVKRITGSLNNLSNTMNETGKSYEGVTKKVSKFDETANKTRKSLEKLVSQKYEILLEVSDRVSPILTNLNNILNRVGSKTIKVGAAVGIDFTQVETGIQKAGSILAGNLNGAITNVVNRVVNNNQNSQLSQTGLTDSRGYSALSGTTNYLSNRAGSNTQSVNNKYWDGFKSSAKSMAKDVTKDTVSSVLKDMTKKDNSLTTKTITEATMASREAMVVMNPGSANPTTTTAIVPYGQSNSSGTTAGIYGREVISSTKTVSSTMQTANAQQALGKTVASSAGVAFAAQAAAVGAEVAVDSLTTAADHFKIASKSSDEKEKKAYNNSGASRTAGTAAGVGIGAAIGSIILPGIGTAIGAAIGGGIGGKAGSYIGDKEIEKYEKEAAAAALAAEQAKYESQELKDALADADMTAEQFGKLFEKAVMNNLTSHFGSIKLSLKEIQLLAQHISFGNNLKNAQKFATAANDAEESFATLQNSIYTMDKINWKVGLKLKLDEAEQESLKSEIANLISNAKTYVENEHYEFSMAVNLLVDDEEAKKIIRSGDKLYNRYQSELDTLGNQLSKKVDDALERGNGVISDKDYDEILAMEDEITGITSKVSDAEQNAQFKALSVKYSGSKMDSDTYETFQAELANQTASAAQTYDDALAVSLSNLDLLLSEKEINQTQYDDSYKAIVGNYRSEMSDLGDKTMNYQLQTIAESYAEELKNVLPDMEGTIAEKLKKVFDMAIEVGDNPKDWDESKIKEIFQLNESVSEDNSPNIANLLLATAKTIPDTGSSLAEAAITQYDEFGDSLQNKFGNGYVLDVPISIIARYSVLNSLSGTNEANQLSNASTKAADTTENGLNTLHSPVIPGVNGINANANGGFIYNTVLSWIGEEGPEVVIPLTQNRRSRGLDLWQKAGKFLGVGQYANGGFVGIEEEVPVSHSLKAEASSSPEVNVNVSVSPTFEVSGNGNGDNMIEIIKAHMKEMADDLGGEIAVSLEKVFSNMPLKEA